MYCGLVRMQCSHSSCGQKLVWPSSSNIAPADFQSTSGGGYPQGGKPPVSHCFEVALRLFPRWAIGGMPALSQLLPLLTLCTAPCCKQLPSSGPQVASHFCANPNGHQRPSGGPHVTFRHSISTALCAENGIAIWLKC